MSEDEAFIRAVLAQPGDDLPRLLYADWLDERGDPRGGYLRSEYRWATAKQSGAEQQLREVASGLDGVWVARISRPPLGLCFDSLQFSRPGPRLTAADLSDTEQRIGTNLPAEYQAFLLNWNGGVPSRPYVGQVDGGFDGEASVEVSRFRSLALVGSAGPDRSAVEKFQYSTVHGTVRKYLVVADAASDRPGDTLLLGLSGLEFGHVFYLYGNPTRRFRPNRLEDAAPNWTGLLANLTEKDWLDSWYDDMASRTIIEKLPPTTEPS